MTTKIPVELSSTPSIVDNGDATAITITSGEQVLIGSANTTNNLRLQESFAIVSTGNLGGMSITGYPSSIASYRPLIDIQRSRGSTDQSMTKVESGDYLGSIVFRGSDGTNFIDGAEISARADGATGTNDMPCNLTFHTQPDGGSGAASERMRINSSGNVGINTSSPTATYKLSIASAANHGGFIYDVGNGYAAIVTKPDSSNNIFPMYMLNNAGAAVGYILSTSSSTTFSQSGSDIFFKENIKDWNENVLDSFKNIKPSTFTYKSDEDKKEIKGYIAQNEFDKFPEAYPINPKDGKHWFNPSGMTVYLMKAIQEQQAIIEDLQQQINEVKNGN